MLKPFGFFDGNPALDLPRSAAACHTGNGHAGHAGDVSGGNGAGSAQA
jgi:primary-amine oxidase